MGESKNGKDKNDKKELCDFTEAINKLNETVSNMQATRAEELFALNDDITKKVDAVESIISENIKQSLEPIKKDISTLQEKIKCVDDSIKQKIMSVYQTITNVQGEIFTHSKSLETIKDFLKNGFAKIFELQNGLQNSLNEKTNSINSKLENVDELTKVNTNKLDRVIECHNLEHSQLQKILSIAKNKLVQYENLLSQKNNELSQISENLTSVNLSYAQEKERNENLQCELAKLKDDKDYITERLNVLKLRYTDFDPFVEEYRKILSYVLCCESLASIITDINNSDDTKNILKFLLIIGDDTSFSNKVYSTMREYKNQNREALTNEELALINLLNNFYKQKLNIEYNVFEIENINSDKMMFDMNSMQDIDKPTDRAFKSVECMYVPALRKDAKTIAFRALVKGTK